MMDKTLSAGFRLNKVQWRRGWDSNPRSAYTDNGFQDRRLQPLSHLSVMLKINC